MNHRKPELGENLAFVAVKHDVYVAELFEAVISARKKGEANCTNLKVEYRGTIEQKAIFLITKDNSVLTQFRVAEELLLRKDIPFDSWMETEKVRKQILKQNKSLGLSTPIQNLRHGMKNINVDGRVLETSEPNVVYTQYGNSATLTNAVISDETGKIKLCLWNTQADTLKKGDTIQIRNASVFTYKNERQLRLGRTGTVNVLQDPVAKANPQREEIAKNEICA